MDPDRKSVLRSSYMMMGALGGFIAAAILTVALIVWLAYYFEGDASPLFWRLVILGSQLILAMSLIVGMVVGRVLFSRRSSEDESEHKGQ